MTRTATFSGRNLLIACAAIFAVVAGGCGSHSSEGAANEYLKNLKLYNYRFCYEALSHQDQLDRTLDQFLSEIPMAPDVSKDWFKGVLRGYNYKIGDSHEEGDKTIVKVTITQPDLALWERTIDAKAAGDPNPNNTPDQLAQKSLTAGDYPTVEYDDNMVFLKQGGEYRLFADFAFKENITKEHNDAVESYHKGDYDKAIDAYKKLLSELANEEATGVDGLKFQYQRELDEIQKIKSQITEAAAYIQVPPLPAHPKLTVSDPVEKMAASRVPGMFGKITNGGDRAIDQVTFTVDYYLGKGKTKAKVYSESHTAISTPVEFTNFTRPVLPFVPGETRDFGFKLNAPIEVQQNQKVALDLNVTGIAFTQSKAPLPKPPAPATPVPSPGAPAAGGAQAPPQTH
ncbi:MAG TPA: hypothetical protein VMU16_12835 [Candidatus Binataceae bacterium]|nr:hypothetical protein [Candidatus Binataceae bacterium]